MTVGRIAEDEIILDNQRPAVVRRIFMDGRKTMSNKNKPIRISLEAARDRYDEGQVTVLDVVDPGTFEQLSYKIKGAVRIDPRDISDEFERLPKERTVLTYCT